MKATLAAVPQFLRFLGTFPTPSDVVEALFRGPLAHVGARGMFLWELRDGLLVALGSGGHQETEMERYGLIPLDVDLGITRAVRDGRLVVDAAPTFGPHYLASLDEQLWADIVGRLGGVSIVSAPVQHAGDAVGALGFITDRPWESVPFGADLVEALTSALGLWITHPLAGLAHAAPAASREWSLAFTPRQREVLRRVEDGAPTSVIAAGLGVSESSVKADLQSAMRALRTSDRREAAERARMLGLL